MANKSKVIIEIVDKEGDKVCFEYEGTHIKIYSGDYLNVLYITPQDLRTALKQLETVFLNWEG